VLLVRGERRAEPPRASRLEVLATLPEFALVDSAGSSFGLDDLAGAPWVADFVFTRCRMSCPLLTGKMRELAGRLPADSRTRLVSISVDPEHDTPEVLRRYAEEQGADGRWRFLTGPRAEVRALVRDGFLLPVEDQPSNESMPVLHSDRFVLVDGAGRVRGYYAPLEAGELDRLLADVDWLETVEMPRREPAGSPP
jgi:cytochrome oxidase Cu insertion factor (SCO1/SenC/PrrC family)